MKVSTPSPSKKKSPRKTRFKAGSTSTPLKEVTKQLRKEFGGDKDDDADDNVPDYS